MLELQRPEHAYLLGFLLGDGSLYAGAGEKGRLSIELAERDEELLVRLAPLLPGGRLTRRTRATNFSACSRTVVLTWCALDVRRAVAAAGMPAGRKDDLVRPPTMPFSERDFARGLIDADGSLGFTAAGVPFVSLVTNSSDMARWWCEVLLTRAQAVRTCRPNQRDGAANVMVQADPAATLTRWLYRPGDLALHRKQVTAESVAAWLRPPTMRARSRPRRWTPAEDIRVMTDLSMTLLALELDRSVAAVVARRWRLRGAGGT